MELPNNIGELLLYVTIIILGFLARTTYVGLKESIVQLTDSINTLNRELNQSIKEQAKINQSVLERVTRLEAISDNGSGNQFRE